MANYKIKSNAFGNKTISKVHLNADAADWVTSDGIKDLGTFDTFDSLITKLGEMHGKDHTDVKAKNYLGHFRAQHSSSFFDIMNNCTYYLGDLWVQSITGNLKLNKGNLSLSSDNIGTFVRKHNAEGWSDWEISNNSEIVDESSEIILRLQGKSDKSNSIHDGFKWLGNFNDGSGFTNAYKLFNEALDSLIYDKNVIGNNYGYFRADVGNHRQLEIKNLLISSGRKYIVQVVSGCFTIRENKIVEAVDIYTVAARIYRPHIQNGEEVWWWEEWKIVSDSNSTIENKIINRLQGNSEDSVNFDPFIKLSWKPSDVNSNINTLCPIVGGDNAKNTGYFRAYSTDGISCLDIKVDVLSWASSTGTVKERFMQTVSGPVTLKNNNTELNWINQVPALGPGHYYRLSEREKDENVCRWSEWKPVNKNEIERIIQGEDDSCKAFNRPFKVLRKSTDTLSFANINDTELWAKIDALHVSSNDYGNTEGTWRFYIGHMPIDLKVIARHYISDMWHQSFESFYECEDYYAVEDGKKVEKQRFILNVNNIKPRKYYRNRINPDGAVGTKENPDGIIINNYWTKWVEVTDELSTAITEIESNALISKTLELKGDEQKLELTGSTIDGTTSVALSFPAATSSMAGVMSADDKEVLNTLNIGSYDTYNDIELLYDEDSDGSEYKNYTPARMNNKDLTSSGYSGYKYDLSDAYSNGYRYIYFRGSNFTVSSDIVRGLVVDNDGSVESFVKTSEPLTNGWQKLPITPNSKYLKATYTSGFPPASYGEVFTPEYINLIKTEGIIDSVNYLTENVDIIKQNASFISFNMLNPDDLLKGFTLSSGKIVNNINGIFSNKLYLEVGKNYTLKNLPVYSVSTVKSIFVARYDETDKFIDRDNITVSTSNLSDYNTVVYTPTSDAAYYRVLLQSGFNQDYPFDAESAMIYEGTDDVETFIPYKPVFVSEYDKMQDEKFSKLNVKNDNVVEQIGNILITGASFAYDGNTWFSKVCKALGVKGYNKAVSGESIRNTAVKMYNGKLYSKAEFEDFDTLLIMHVHNQDVCNETGLQNNYADYNVSTSMSYSQAYDYVLKKYAAECYAAKDNKDSKWYGTKCGKPFKVVCMTHWHDARTIFNDSIRRLKEKWGFKLIELDKEIGFSKNQVHPVTGTQISIMHSVDTETIDNIVYGWHPSRDNEPYIQDRIADIVVRSLKR